MTTHYGDDMRHLASAPVVVGADGSADSDAAVVWAAATAVQRGRSLRIVHGLNLPNLERTLEPYGLLQPPVLESLRAHGAQLAEHAREIALEAAPGLRVETEVSPDEPVRLLLRYGQAAHMVVLGGSGAGGLAAHLGSILLAVTSHAAGAVVVVRSDPDSGGRVGGDGPVVVGVDGGPVSDAAIGAAFEEAAERGTELVAVHVWNDANFGNYLSDPYLMFPTPVIEVTEQALLAERLAGWAEKFPEVSVTRTVYPSRATRALLDCSATARLLVVGSRGRGRVLGALLGSTSNALVQHAKCPVMVVHPDERHRS